MRKIRTSSVVSVFVAAALASTSVLANDAEIDPDDHQVEDFYFASPFDACFNDDYHLSHLTENEAFDRARCFTALLAEHGDDLGASAHTIMQYSASWYSTAAEKGHEVAKVNLEANLVALNQIESDTHQDAMGGHEMLASEVQFQGLDLDQNGLLSQSEIASSGELKSTFSHSDLDRDGQLSYGEFSIMAGEATAAGH